MTEQDVEREGESPDDLAREPASVLVVDDRPDKLLVMTTMLADTGARIVTATSGEDALRRVLEEDFAVILLDVNMPTMDGFETAALIRSRRRSAHTPIIFVTAFADEMHTAHGYALGAVDYILTPVLPEVLQTKVSVFVRLHRMARQISRQADERVALEREHAARLAAEDSIRRFSFLASASELLGSSLDAEAMILQVTRFVVPFMCDASAVTLADADGELQAARIAWARPDGQDGHAEALATLADESIVEATQRAMRTGKTALVQSLPIATSTLRTRDAAGGAAEIDVGVPLGLGLALPLMARGRRLGVLLLLLRSGREQGRYDIPFAEDLADRLAIALDNALLYRRVQEADQRKNEFLAMLAHELRNPLAPIRNAVELLRLDRADQRAVNWARDIIDRQTGQLARLVDDLLDVSRITHGKVHLEHEPVELAQVVQAAVEVVRPLVDERRHELSVVPPEDGMRVAGDFGRLAQVLSNLLNNAAKYTPAGGRISLEVARVDGNVELRVADSGIGIPREMLASIFEPFTQVSGDLDRAQGGLGIGLTLVKQLVELHGGSVRAYSDGPDRGSRFVVRLPLMADGGVRAVAHVRDDRGEPLARRVLVVDDNVDSAESMAALLRLLGCEVELAHDGVEALDAARAFRPDAILLDIGLPKMDGYAVATRLRDDASFERLRLIALTGYGQPEDRVRAASAGFDHHLIKPAELDTLRRLLG